MITLTINELEKLTAGSEVLQAGRNGPKVLRLSNSNCLKFFRLKTLLSSALYYHYANRYADNAIKLLGLGIETTRVVNLYFIPKGYIKNSLQTKAVEYQYLPGLTVRDLITNNQMDEAIIRQFASFVGKLHSKGIFFRAIHLANIIYNENFTDKFGLIDVDNTKFYNKALNFKQRQRNFELMLCYKVDKDFMLKHKNLFINHYAKCYNHNELDSLIV